MTRPAISDLSPKFQEQARQQLASTRHPRTVRIEPAGELPPIRSTAKPRLRQKEKPLNRTEQDFQTWLKDGFPGGVVMSQVITLRLANGVRYTPDFVVRSSARVADGEADASMLRVYEVKGFMRDDAAVKLKVAATLFPWMKFILVSRCAGGWDLEDVLP